MKILSFAVPIKHQTNIVFYFQVTWQRVAAVPAIQNSHISQNCNGNTSHDVHKNSHDMAWYLWMEEETDTFLSVRRDIRFKTVDIRFKTVKICSCILKSQGRNEGEGFPEAVAKICSK